MTSVNAQHEALLDELLKDYTDPKDILGEHGLLKRTASDNPSQEVSGRAPHHHCVGMLGQATPPTLDADSDPIGQASAARTCWAAHRDIAMESSV
jgi:hypothetical protein